MKQYEYVSVRIGRFFGAGSEEHREVIDGYAASAKVPPTPLDTPFKSC